MEALVTIGMYWYAVWYWFNALLTTCIIVGLTLCAVWIIVAAWQDFKVEFSRLLAPKPDPRNVVDIRSGREKDSAH